MLTWWNSLCIVCSPVLLLIYTYKNHTPEWYICYTCINNLYTMTSHIWKFPVIKSNFVNVSCRIYWYHYEICTTALSYDDNLSIKSEKFMPSTKSEINYVVGVQLWVYIIGQNVGNINYFVWDVMLAYFHSRKPFYQFSSYSKGCPD